MTKGQKAFVVAVSFDPVNDPNSLPGFQAVSGSLSNAVLVGPYSGKLDNGGENVELYTPGAPIPAGAPDAGFVPCILVERVRYDAALPWVAGMGADGTGKSMRRRDPQEYANDPANWMFGPPNPAWPPPPRTPPALPAIGDTCQIHVVAADLPLVVARSTRVGDVIRLIRLGWRGTAGRTYQVEASAGLHPMGWVPAGPPVTADREEMWVRADPQGQATFRVWQLP